MYVRDLKGDEFPLQATLNHEMELNGNQSVSATIYSTKVNSAYIDDITEMWELVDFDNVSHKIIYAKKKGEGNRLTVDVKAIPLFFDTFDTLRIYEEYNEHMTVQLAFTRIFKDTGFNFVLVDAFDAVQWEGFGGGETRLETFKRALERYQAEFRISGNTVYLHKQIGRDTQFQYRYRLNASNITQENDASAMWTYAKGYGDYEDGGEEGGGGGWETAKLTREYTSPLAKIIGIRHAPPIKDGRVKVKEAMDKALKELVDESLKISVSADIHDLRKQGYPLAQPELGDRVFLIDERIGLDEEVRVVDVKIMRNWKGEVLDLNLTFGSESITKRHQSNLQTAIKDITEIMAGRKKIPFSAYDAAVINATNALKGITSELVVPENGGLMAVDKNNPNNLVLFNAAGFGISNDGGGTFKTAMTGDGIAAEVIIAESLNAITTNTGELNVNGWMTITAENAGIRSRYDYGDPLSATDPRWYVGDYFNENRFMFYKSDVFDVTSSGKKGSYKYHTETVFAGDQVKLRQYNNESLQSSYASVDITAGYIWLRRQNFKNSIYINGKDGYIDVYGTGAPSTFYAGIQARSDRGLETLNVNTIKGYNTLTLNKTRTDLGDLVLTKDSVGAYVKSDAIRSRTTSASANLRISLDQGILEMVSSSKRFKVDIKQYDHNPYDILRLIPKNWYDKNEFLTRTNYRRYNGLIAEEVEEVGLRNFVEYDENGNVQTVEYDRLWINLIPIAKDHQNEIDNLKQEIKRLSSLIIRSGVNGSQ